MSRTAESLGPGSDGSGKTKPFRSSRFPGPGRIRPRPGHPAGVGSGPGLGFQVRVEPRCGSPATTPRACAGSAKTHVFQCPRVNAPSPAPRRSQPARRSMAGHRPRKSKPGNETPSAGKSGLPRLWSTGGRRSAWPATTMWTYSPKCVPAPTISEAVLPRRNFDLPAGLFLPSVGPLATGPNSAANPCAKLVAEGGGRITACDFALRNGTGPAGFPVLINRSAGEAGRPEACDLNYAGNNRRPVRPAACRGLRSGLRLAGPLRLGIPCPAAGHCRTGLRKPF